MRASLTALLALTLLSLPAASAGDGGIEQAVASVCAALGGAPEAARPAMGVAQELGACPLPAAEAGSAPKKVEPEADAQPPAQDVAGEAVASAESLAGEAQSFAGEALADPTGVPDRAPAFLDTLLGWLGAQLGLVPKAIDGAAHEVSKILDGAGEAVDAAGLGLGSIAKDAGKALEEAAHAVAAAVEDLGKSLGELLGPRRAGADLGTAPLPRAPAPKDGLDVARGLLDALPVQG
jgi:hypothetical protein